MRLVHRLISIADGPDDTDDGRLRKRIGVVAGYATIVAPAGAPALSGFHPLSLVLAPALSLVSAANLALLARSRRFDRYVTVLLATGVVFTVVMDTVSGGLASGAGIVWGFLGPVYAILALGPRKAIPWFGVFVAALLLTVALDPWVSATFPPPPYAVRLASFAQNIGLPLGMAFALLYYTDVRRRAAEARSEELLTNAIPASIATRLKHGEQRIAEAYPATTVLFADIVGFTPWANRTDPATVVALLDDLFTRFDEAAAEEGVEKVKTIGDAYMAVAGAPDMRDDHADAALSLALRMLRVVEGLPEGREVPLQVRIGLASGPVVAGVIGQRRILFDLWGDTVNTASRLESHGVPGRIQVSERTRELVSPTHEFEPRDLEVKGLGQVRAYLLR